MICYYSLSARHTSFFFFKQKTAYEMRISDWSSDVCSSDLGKNILGSGWDYDCFVHTGAGRYICGEETALINSLEGRRANPRAKPPFPQISGAWGRPTVVNNVESLCNIAPIVVHGADWFKGLSQGKSKDGGTKLDRKSTRLKRTGEIGRAHV